jgi:hypothetical protein
MFAFMFSMGLWKTRSAIDTRSSGLSLTKYERRSKNRPQNAARAVFCGGVKVDHRRNLVS